MLLSLSEECAVFGVMPDMSEVADALPGVELSFLEADIDDVDQR